MESTINMQDMRHLNLFSEITKIDTRFCFEYNNTIFFCVPRNLVSRAIGEDGRNSKQLSYILAKRVKIIPCPAGLEEIGEFVRAIIFPVEFKNIDVAGNEVVLHAGSKNKAALIGREKRRLLEMKKIVHDFFGKEFRIV
jgi:transcription antitermination factor NusA-like protein